jgi:hypothetical protein
VEGYLLTDLKSMAAIPTAPVGAVAWPMVISVLSGMELLGALLFDKPFNSNNGDTYFRHYWTHFLCAGHPQYQSIHGGDGLMRSPGSFISRRARDYRNQGPIESSPFLQGAL